MKTNQAVLSPSSSLLTSSASVSEMSYQSNGGTNNRNKMAAKMETKKLLKNNNSSNNSNKGAGGGDQTAARRERRSSAKTLSNNKPLSKTGKSPDSRALAFSRHRSSGCLQSRHCHSTLSLSRARSSSALNRVQSRSMNLLIIQNNNNNNNKAHGVPRDHVSALTNQNGICKSDQSDCALSLASSDVLTNDSEEEDEGVATDATNENTASAPSNNTNKDIKANSKRSKFQKNRAKNSKEDNMLAQGKSFPW